ncbi:hypothetical protein [Rhizosphaericola mali]|uniref:Uncharacterized protein n=1 Tax=Rhizosphaericola mali TaxID=2545455 RepID=A0A5P2FXG5_9BACT|nr:hypothetical protein [Rhizosphaericola mali]QES87627.1 hypothetical protein E0W69_002730 [Rhizosphaericola mali]
MSETKLNKLEIDECQLATLPLFYRNIIYNELTQLSSPLDLSKYIEDWNSYIYYESSENPISKIIDYSIEKFEK